MRSPLQVSKADESTRFMKVPFLPNRIIDQTYWDAIGYGQL